MHAEHRIAYPTFARADAKTAGQQSWRSLLFMHWPVRPERLRSLVPSRLTLDTFEGMAYVSITPFTVRRARVRGLPPIPGTAAFDEVNVRTYVRLDGEPGVWFFSLDASSRSATALARLGLRLPYRHARIERDIDGDAHSFECERTTHGRQPASLRAFWTAEPSMTLARPGTLEHFLVERYTLYSHALGSKLWRGQIRHAPWPLQAVSALGVEQTLDQADGLPELGECRLAQHSPGVDVEFLPFKLV
jgi:uncharacterized protein